MFFTKFFQWYQSVKQFGSDLGLGYSIQRGKNILSEPVNDKTNKRIYVQTYIPHVLSRELIPAIFLTFWSRGQGPPVEFWTIKLGKLELDDGLTTILNG